MLKYFKKQKVRRQTSCEPVKGLEGADKNAAGGEFASTDSGKRNSLRSSSSFCDEVFLEELGVDEDAASLSGGVSLGSASIGCAASNIVDEDLFRYQSRLSMTLSAIVGNPNCLSYFLQYLETKEALPLIKFYLDTNNFKTAALAQLEKEHMCATQGKCTGDSEEDLATVAQVAVATVGEQKAPLQKGAANSALQNSADMAEADEENNSVPELKTLCDLSMRKPLTDDEKSRIYAETNKQITKCHSQSLTQSHKLRTHSELSLCSIGTQDADMESACLADQVSAASVNDAMTVYQKYLIADAKHFVCLPIAILSQISLLLCQRDEAGSLPISARCFDEAQRHVLLQLEQDYLNDFLQSTFYCKYCIELIEGAGGGAYENSSSTVERGEEELNIYDVLYSEVTLFFFMEFLEQQNERECLDFWTAAINFRQSYSATSTAAMELQADAMIIYDKFFSLQSDCRLWLSDRLRSHVEERICAVDHIAYCFDLPLHITAKYLERKYFKDFLKSQLFENYLNELKTKVHDDFEMATAVQEAGNGTIQLDSGAIKQKLKLTRSSSQTSLRHRKTRSDCSSESTQRDLFKYISQHNTLLAMDSSGSSASGAHLKHLHTTGSSLSIDSRQLTNPNLLWRRASATDAGSGLKFGRINALGRYERDFQTVEAFNNAAAGKHSWSLSMSGHKLKNAMRKLVHLPEDKMQEEIAWQVAEMIIKDVTNITLNNGAGKPVGMVDNNKAAVPLKQ